MLCANGDAVASAIEGHPAGAQVRRGGYYQWSKLQGQAYSVRAQSTTDAPVCTHVHVAATMNK